MRLARRSLAPAGLLVGLAAASLAYAAAPTARPEPAEPYRDKPAIAVENITFLLKANAGLGPGDQDFVFFEVAASKERDADGTLRSGTLPADPKLPKLRTFQRRMKWNPKLGQFSYTLPAKEYAHCATTGPRLPVGTTGCRSS